MIDKGEEQMLAGHDGPNVFSSHLKKRRINIRILRVAFFFPHYHFYFSSVTVESAWENFSTAGEMKIHLAALTAGRLVSPLRGSLSLRATVAQINGST